MIMRVVPDAPANVSFIGPWKLIGGENWSAIFEWVKPAIRKGIIRKYVLDGTCVDRHSGGNAIQLPLIEFAVHDEKSARYQLDVSSLPSFSTCTLSVAASTSVGRGENKNIEVETPIISEIVLFYLFVVELKF